MSEWPAGTARIELAETDSTMAEAARRAASTPLPYWILATTQSAGRGRRGRAWVPGPGNFYASLTLNAPADPGVAALRSFAAALALTDCLKALGVPADDVSLKWPNDVLLRDRKLAGILLEATQAQGRPLLIIGIGINLAQAPPNGRLEPHAVPPIALAEVGLQKSPGEVLDVLAPAYAAWEYRLSTAGFAPLRDAWLGKAARLGHQITARLPQEDITGRFETVDPTGAIVLDTPSGRRTIPAADIHF